MPAPHRTDRAREAADFFRKKRVVDGGDLPVEKYLEAMHHVRNMPRYSLQLDRYIESTPSAGASPFGAWTLLGPGNRGGRTEALVIHPQDANTMWAAAATGGIWKTTDGGQTWIDQTDFAPVLTLKSLVISPWDFNTLFAGTGDQTLAWRGAGIFRTTDGGDTWTQLPATATSDFYFVSKVAVSFNTAPRLYAATWSGVFTSPDGGATWKQSLATGPGGCFDMALQPGALTDVVFAACQIPGSIHYAIYRNLDAAGAGAWVSVFSDPQMYTTALAIAPSQPSTVYAVANNIGGATYAGGLRGVYRSLSNGDAGTWTTQVSNSDPPSLDTAILSSEPGNSLSSFCNDKAPNLTGQGGYNLHADVDPLDPDRLWVGGIGLFRSDDGGVTWGSAGLGSHTDHHALVFSPGYDGDKNQTIINANDGGVYMTTQGRGKTGTCASTSSTVTWTSLNHGYATTQFYHGTPYPGGATYVGGTQDVGTVRGTDAGGIDQWTGIYLGDGGVTRLDPVDSTRLFAEFYYLNNFGRSTDGGFTFQTVTRGITEASMSFPFTPDYVFDPNNSLRMYLGGTLLWRTEDGANNWTAAAAPNPQVGPDDDPIASIAVSPDDPNLVLYGTSYGFIFRSANALKSNGSTPWIPVQPRVGYVQSIEFDARNPSIVYATYASFKRASTDHHVYRSSDGGLSWRGIDGSGSTGLPDVPVETLLVDPDDSSRLYAGTDLGIFVSLDGGNTWANDDNPLPNTIVTTLAIDKTGGVKNLYVFTYGRSLWRVPLGGAASTCTYSVTPTATIDATGGTASVDVGTQPGCAWSALPTKSAALGFTVQPPGSGVGGGKAFFTVTRNINPIVRTGTFLVQGQTVTVSQEAASAPAIGDELATAQPIASVPYVTYVSNVALTANATDPMHSCTNSADFKTGWYLFTGPTSGPVDVSAQGYTTSGIIATLGVVLTAYPVTGNTIGSELQCTTSPKGSSLTSLALIAFTATAGRQYAIEIGTLDPASNGTIFLSVFPPPPPVTAAVSPSTVTINAGQKQQFTSQIGGLANTAVRWTVSPNVGFVSPAGLYAAPALADAPTKVTITATSLANPALSAAATVTVQTSSFTVAKSGVMNAASFQGGAVSPGEIVTIFGIGLGPVDLAAAQLDSLGNVASSLAGTQVLFDGMPAPLVHASSTQVTAVVPYDVAGRATTQVVVSHNGISSAPMTVPVTTTAPAIFTANSSGSGPAAILDQDNLLNSLYAAPRGSIVTLFATGEGQTDPPGFNGRVPGPVLPKPVAPVSVQIGGVNAGIQYVGGAPQQVAGVLQVNVTVPPSVSPGLQPIVLKAGNNSSPSNVTINVLGPDSRVGSISFYNPGTTPLTLNVYKPDDLGTPIPIGTVLPGRYPIFPFQNQVGSDWYLQVNSSPLRVVSHVCAYYPDTLIGPYWDCAGTAENPFPR